MFLEYLISVGVVAFCTVTSILLRSSLAPPTFAMVYLLGVIAVSIRCRRPAATLNAVLSATAFDYFCAPFHNNFFLEDSNYIVTLVAMLVVALVISTLTFERHEGLICTANRPGGGMLVIIELPFKHIPSRLSVMSESSAS